MIEQILRDFVVANPSFSMSILRYFNPVGAHPSGRIGENPHGPPNNLMPFVQQVAVGRREALSVFGSDYSTHDGTGVRDYIHVDDLAEGHICALQKLFTMDGGCITHNLGSGTGYSVLDMVKAFEEACGKKIPYKMVDRRPGDLGTVVANPGKAKADFDWQTKRGLQEMCNSAWKWQSNNPYGYEEGGKVSDTLKNLLPFLGAQQGNDAPRPRAHDAESCTGRETGVEALLAVAAAALVLVASASDAFVTAQAPVQKSGLAALPARASRATPVQSQGTGFFRTAAATALMCIALSACRRSPQPKIRVHAVQCKSFAISEAQAPEVTPCASFSCDSSTSVETLLDLDAPSASCLAATPLMTEVTIQVE
ncbi:unnamed protein product, partial [Effrenium voratum]